MALRDILYGDSVSNYPIDLTALSYEPTYFLELKHDWADPRFGFIRSGTSYPADLWHVVLMQPKEAMDVFIRENPTWFVPVGWSRQRAEGREAVPRSEAERTERTASPGARDGDEGAGAPKAE